MTTYTAIPGTDIDTDSPITESLMTKLRDNPIAITEGSAGAPKIQHNAMAVDSVDFSSNIQDVVTDGSLNCSGGAFNLVPKGVVNLVMSAGTAMLQYFANGAWTTSVNVSTTVSAQCISDGVNVRIGGFGGTNTCQYRRIYQ